MNNAAIELKSDENEVTDVGISADGAWQRRGFSSHNGTYTVISLKSLKNYSRTSQHSFKTVFC